MSYLKFVYRYFILNGNKCDDIFQYMFTDNHHKSIKKNAKVRVKRSPIFKDRFFDKGNNKITELRTILQRESQNS